ncbi:MULTISPECIES: aminotransferase class I/II-fold pyridoxal phosphate-dependent enzyme [unclassified Bacteroides]|jgi:8-amino-7-oxononanoate synthase|uniref:serine palmitoyltransferase n=1 Tax=unclassified Bacteroides TaxID=2646097 RepID=UPI000E9B4306|nr:MULTISPECIES: aminotransferase class I/II-fold pyridoxal phosphate-dependent enzyme [unclassified Bacteroides]RGN48604.1 aminotransferase class I/II-fold pyridoxal phosphate-dependent enzyme [Bacteroides sp. OM05-12]RHR75566.1 aminotransferase class I/II-fold pyridoxal phosphate-dependent enzyme [Bacteroides sp. AF16-49]
MGLLQDKLAKYTLPQEVKAKGVYPYFREIDSAQDTEVLMDGKKVLMFGSNSYMGLTYDQRIINAAIAATRKYGTGCAGSRFLNGTLDLHVQLEQELAEFVGKEDALVYSTGFTVNEGVVSCLTDRNDYIICDDRDHASIVDGRRLSFSTQLKYRHNDMAALEKELAKCKPESVKLIVVDGVFSMEGDLAKLPEIVKLSEKYNGCIMVDEAHGLGVFGKQGRGVCNHFGLTDKVDLIMGTFSKSLASIGGFIAADKATINWLRHNSRSYIFSASNTPAATAAAMEALHIIQNEPERQENLWKITNYALKCFRDAGFEIGDTASPIIPLYVRDMEKTFMITKMAFDEGVFINPVIPPACAPQDTLVRFALMATHTKEQIDFAVDKLVKCFKKLDVIK